MAHPLFQISLQTSMFETCALPLPVNCDPLLQSVECFGVWGVQTGWRRMCMYGC